MLNQYEIAARWVSQLENGIGGFHYRGRTLKADGLTIGSAWGNNALAQYLPRERGRPRPLILVTGDRWDSPGWGHTDLQTEVRTAAQRNELGADVLVVPFAALSAAGIVFESIRPLEIRSDRNETIPRTAERLGELPRWERTYNETLEHSAETLDEVPADKRKTWQYDSGRGEYADIPRGADGLYHWTEHKTREREPAADGLFHWTEHRHWLGDSVFTAETRGSRTISRPRSVSDVVRIAAAAARAESMGSGLGVVETLERLDVFEPTTETVETRRRRRYVSSFDYQESPALYFLATLPRASRAESVESAIQDLAPAAVHAAIARGRDVARQGDIFAIATELDTETVYGLARSRARLTQLTRSARPRPGEVSYRPPLSAAGRRAFRTWRRARFLDLFREVSGRAASRDIYLAAPQTTKEGDRAARRRARASGLVELGRAAALGSSEPTSAIYRSNEYQAKAAAERAAARFALSRSARHRVRDQYRRLYGSNARSAWDQANREARERFGIDPVYLQGERERIRAALSVYGTTHTATEVVHARGGSVYLRGIMRHEPSLDPNRRGGRDHRDLRLGDRETWYLAIRNTVPRGSAVDTNRR